MGFDSRGRGGLDRRVTEKAAEPLNDWVEVVTSVPSVLEDAATAAVTEAGIGAGGFEIRDQGSFKRSQPGRVELVFVTRESDVGALTQRIDHALAPIGMHSEITTTPAPEAAWRDKWKEYFKVFYVTSRIVIVPSWERHSPTTAEVVLNLDPGRAFGTGQHESTRLCLRALDAIETRGFYAKRVLDVGCGSGILTVAALKLWPESRAVMDDVDEDSVRVAMENLELNGLESRVRGETRPLAKLPGKFDLVLANIQLDVLEQLLPALVARVEVGGVLIVSGLLKGQELLLEAQLAQSKAGRGFATWGRGAEGDWTALVLYRGR
jgi:ribosomal protein L11 methyltransferase